VADAVEWRGMETIAARTIDVSDVQRRQIEARSACVVEHGATTDRYGRAWESVRPWLDAANDPIVELRATCPGCDWPASGVMKHAVFGESGASLGRYTIELRSVSEEDEGDPDEVGRFEVSGQRCYLWWPDAPSFVEGEEVIDVTDWFDPLPVPGRDMVAVLTKVA
jgi:hypothetical protein